MSRTLTAIIPYYRGARDIRACVDSILSSDVPVSSLIIVDNCPEGLDRTLLPSGSRIPIRILVARPGIGFGRACNLGIVRALETPTDAILLINQDAHLMPGSLGKLSDALFSDPEAAISCGFSMTYDGNGISDFWMKGYVRRNAELSEDYDRNRMKAVYVVPPNGANGACVLIRSSFLRLELFDPVIHMYGEEHDLFDRIVRRGGKVLLVQEARYGHRHANASAGVWDRARNDGRILFAERVQMIRSSASFGSALIRVFRSTAVAYVGAIFSCRLFRLVWQFLYDLRLLGILPAAVRGRRPGELLNVARSTAERDFLSESTASI